MSAAFPPLPVFTRKAQMPPRERVSSDLLSQRHPIGFHTVCLAVFCEWCAAYILGASMVLLLRARWLCGK